MENVPGKAFGRARPVIAPRRRPRPYVLSHEERADIPQTPPLPGAWLQSAVAAETRIMTPAGPRAAGLLTIGDLVLTVDRGAMPLRWVGSRGLSARQLAERPELGAVLVPRNAFGGGAPCRDLRLSPLAGILHMMQGAPEGGVLIDARDMIGLKGIVAAPARPVTYIQLLLDDHAIIAADGLAVETFHPGALQPEPVNSRQRAEVIACFPDLEHGLELYGPEARPRAERRR